MVVYLTQIFSGISNKLQQIGVGIQDLFQARILFVRLETQIHQSKIAQMVDQAILTWGTVVSIRLFLSFVFVFVQWSKLRRIMVSVSDVKNSQKRFHWRRKVTFLWEGL